MDFLGNLPICLLASESLWGLLWIPALDTKMFTLNSLPVTSPVKTDLLRISKQLYPRVSNYGCHKRSPPPQPKKTVTERKLQSLISRQIIGWIESSKYSGFLLAELWQSLIGWAVAISHWLSSGQARNGSLPVGLCCCHRMWELLFLISYSNCDFFY